MSAPVDSAWALHQAKLREQSDIAVRNRRLYEQAQADRRRKEVNERAVRYAKEWPAYSAGIQVKDARLNKQWELQQKYKKQQNAAAKTSSATAARRAEDERVLRARAAQALDRDARLEAADRAIVARPPYSLDKNGWRQYNKGSWSRDYVDTFHAAQRRQVERHHKRELDRQTARNIADTIHRESSYGKGLPRRKEGYLYAKI